MPRNGIPRNAACPCGSGSKFKRCHGRDYNSTLVPEIKRMLNMTDNPVCWIISNQKATAVFSDKQNRILVFKDREIARQIALLDLFTDQSPNEIYIAPVDENVWQKIQAELPFVLVENLKKGIALIEERIESQRVARGYDTPTE